MFVLVDLLGAPLQVYFMTMLFYKKLSFSHFHCQITCEHYIKIYVDDQCTQREIIYFRPD